MADGNIVLRRFQDIDLEDSFFDSLKESYVGFEAWYEKKKDEYAYVMEDYTGIQAFLFLKFEHGPVRDVNPPLNTNVCLKVGTFKVNAHGTKLGERFVKKIFDHAIVNNIDHIYVTVFPEHRPLIAILERYGFAQYGVKESGAGTELVLVKNFNKLSNDSIWNYPVVNATASNCWLMSVQPQWHTKLFPDSILRTESASIIQDVSHTNSIHKVYIGWMNGMDQIRPNDIVLMYRMAGENRRPWFESVITSICVVQANRQVRSFGSYEEFKKAVAPYSVFSENDLRYFYNSKPHGWVVSMTYNIALPKRLNMQKLVDDVGLDRNEYWGFRYVNREQLLSIAQFSNVPSCALVL